MAFRVLRVVNVSKQLAEEEPRAPPEERRASFRKKFRRAGSLGLPFVPESEIPNIREYWSSVDDEAEPVFKQDQENNGSLLTVILMTRPGSSDLSTALSIVEKFNAKSVHIESRKPQHANVDCLEVLLILEVPQAGNAEAILKTMKDCGLQVTEPKTHASLVRTMSPAYSDDVFGHTAVDDDLDIAAKRVLMYGTELDADHPGFKDTVYRQRRLMFADLALNYRHGQPIPRVEYTPEETKTWGTMYRELRRLHTLYACSEYLENFRLMEEKCGYSENNIPQLEDVSKFLKGKTGFQVRPVAGYLSSRDFLASLAFRVFPCTQYIRHPTDPFYTPEPDCCHELMGHMPLFAEADFAQFSQEIGLASLGATDDDVQKLATLYFFTVEFGLCKQDNQLKVYGAGLLSSAAELQHAVEGSPETLAFDPDRVIQQECLITTYQTTYFYTESFEEAQDKIRMFTSNMRRPFVTRYNAYTESIELLNDKTALTAAVNSLRLSTPLTVPMGIMIMRLLTASFAVYHGSIGMMEKLGWTIEFSALLNKKQSEKTCNSDSKGCYDEGKKKSGEDVTLHWRRRLYDDLLFPKDEKTIVAPNNALILFEDAEKDQVDKGIRVKVYRDGKEQESHLIKDKTQVVTFEKKKEEHKSESSGDSGTSYASNCAYQPQSCPG